MKGVHAVALCVFVFHCIPGSRRAQATRETSLGNTSIKPQLNGSLPPQTPSRASLMGLPPTPASRLPHKTLGPSTLHKPSEGDGSIQGESNKHFCHFIIILGSLIPNVYNLLYTGRFPGSEYSFHCALLRAHLVMNGRGLCSKMTHFRSRLGCKSPWGKSFPGLKPVHLPR